MNEMKKRWGGFNLTAMEMKQQRLIKDSLEEQQELGSLSSLSRTCWCSSRPIYYCPRLYPTTAFEILMSSSSFFFFFILSHCYIFYLSPLLECNICMHSGTKRKPFFKNIFFCPSWFFELTKY